MSEDKIEHIEYLKKIFFGSNDFIPDECEVYLKEPKFKDLYIGYIRSPKKMHVLDKETNTRFIY